MSAVDDIAVQLQQLDERLKRLENLERPNQALDLTSAPTFQDLLLTQSLAGGVGPVLQLNNEGNAADDQAEIQFLSNSSVRAYLNWRVRAGGAGYMNFFTGPAGAPTKKMELNENGLLDLLGTFRSTSQVAPSSGTGVELYYYVAGDYAELLSYNRTGSARKPLRITASSLLLDGTSNYIAATSWTPTWTGTGGVNPAIGNGSQAHFYVRYGDVCYIWGNITMGTTTTYGTGGWEFTVPIAAINNPRFQIGAAQILDSGVADYVGVVRHDASTGKFRIIMTAGNTAGNGIPHAWGNTDVLAYALTYRVN